MGGILDPFHERIFVTWTGMTGYIIYLKMGPKLTDSETCILIKDIFKLTTILILKVKHRLTSVSSITDLHVLGVSLCRHTWFKWRDHLIHLISIQFYIKVCTSLPMTPSFWSRNTSQISGSGSWGLRLRTTTLHDVSWLFIFSGWSPPGGSQRALNSILTQLTEISNIASAICWSRSPSLGVIHLTLAVLLPSLFCFLFQPWIFLFLSMVTGIYLSSWQDYMLDRSPVHCWTMD